MSIPSTPPSWPAGYRILPRVSGLAPELVEAFRDMPVAAIGDAMSRHVGAIGLHPFHGRLDTVLCGPAFTVRVRPGDNLMIHKALMMAEPGDVLVIAFRVAATSLVHQGGLRTHRAR